ncbi:RNA polymerase sigma-70 factor [Mucilaginibacter sp. KACC 22063]|uniref:RNA polymerase sigma-70 factor n=1 Tax=Mucilaginibacter sp. KACC 22063 TaxID=3025666 RepID=UPI0023654C81|nr:RNA polymerase sigma-70 factor [Mucilaginibacter sp. KACC 22063]WDF57368.1 RNA polymerase sigma-70 factor [Mucilaginibacter sp. KACC 22063]
MYTNQNEQNPGMINLEADSPDFDNLYLTYFNALHRYAYTMVADKIIAEEMVHQVFWKILERKEGIQIHTSIKAYLYRSVYHECLNYFKHQKIKQAYESNAVNQEKSYSDHTVNKLQYKELEQKVKMAINGLPEQCRTIFQLSRFEELKYAEIAHQLGLSVKTVETQMSRALKKLRVQLVDYLPLLMWFMLNYL